MKAVAVFPGQREVRVIDEPEPRIETPTQARLRVLDVGVCGTDREICAFEYGTPPPGHAHLVIGHESLARVEEVGRTSAAAFLAHHYTRYLGDLSGGQVIRAALERSLGVTDGAGASFFSFPDVRPGALKKRYRELLDEVPFDAAQREELVAEALVAYRLNVALAAELDADLPRWTTA